MKHPHCFYGRLVRYRFVLATAGLIFATAPIVDPSGMVSAQDGKPYASEAVQERIYSGPQPDEEIKPFKVLYIKGDNPHELEIVPEADERTTLICFVHRLSNDDKILFGLGLVDFYALRHKELTSHIVLLSDDRDKITKMLRGWTQGPLFTKSLVSVSVDGIEGPGNYGLNRFVAMTVLVAKGNKVVDNLVFNAPNNRDLETIMTAVAKAHGKPEPTLAQVQQELRSERQRQADTRIKASPVFKLAPNEQLGRIMFGMVNGRGNRSQNAKRHKQQFLDWAGDDEERKSALQKYCKAIVSGKFELNQDSLAALQKLAAD